MIDFPSGWHPSHAAAGAAALASLGLAGVRADYGDDRPLPPAFSLSALRVRHLEQCGVGTCWIHSATQGVEVATAAEGVYEAVPVSRMMIAHTGEILMARAYGRSAVGNPDDGGSVAMAFLAASTTASGGTGACKEATWPYLPDDLAKATLYGQRRGEARQYLAMDPPSGALAEAEHNRFGSVADVPIDDGTPWKRAIFNGDGVGIGIWWTGYWDTQGATFFDRIGGGEYGHALLVIGWVEHQGNLYWQLDNWHGLLYAPLPAEVAQSVPGYRPISAARTSDFWVEDSTLRRVMSFGSAEHVVGSGVSGFTRKDPLANLAGGLSV